MDFIKHKFKELLYISIIFLIINLIYTGLIYFQILKVETNTLRTITYITVLILFFIYGFLSGLKEGKNGWLSGLTSALIIIITTIILNIFTKNPFNFAYFIKLLTYLICSIIGGMLGVNMKK